MEFMFKLSRMIIPRMRKVFLGLLNGTRPNLTWNRQTLHAWRLCRAAAL
jgi:hypothetical protein